jgi:hypothetical protein
MLGKIIDGQLIIATDIVKDGKKTVTRPTDTILQSLGYKEIVYTYKPKFDDEEEKLIENYKETDNQILVEYTVEKLTDEEHNEIINQKIQNEYNKVTKEDLINYVSGQKGNNAIDEIINNVNKLKSTLITGEDK